MSSSSRGSLLGSPVVQRRVGTWLFVMTVLSSALLVGSLLTWALCAVAAALALSVFLLWFEGDGSRARPVASILVFTAAALTAFTALQCIPMPSSILTWISPANADVWARALTPLHEAGPAYPTISLDPYATRVQVLRGIAYILTFVAALRIAHRQEGAVLLQTVLSVCGVVLAVTAIMHPAFGIEKVFWLYKPTSGALLGTHVAPLIDSNHLAGYVNIAICTSLGGALAPKAGLPRPILFAIFLMLVGFEVWIASRGGFVGMTLGIIVVLVMSFAARRGRGSSALQAMLVVGVVAASLVTIVLGASDTVRHELASADVSKLTLAREAMRMIPASPWLGVGRGAFESTFPAFRSLPGYVAFTHPENIVAQWSIEWGVPIAAFAMAAMAFALRPASVMARSVPPIGAWAALAAVGVQNLVDFSLEVPGVVIPLVVCAAIVTGGSGGDIKQSALNLWATKTRSIAFGALGLCAIGLVLVIPVVGHDLSRDQFAMKDLAVDPHTTRDEFHRAIRATMLRHPAEPYFPLLGALRASNANDESVIPWIERALERAQVYGPAHLILAHSIYARSPSQARLEYRLALEQDPSTQAVYENEAPGLVRSFDDAMQLLPPEVPMRSVALYSLTNHLRERLPATAKRLDEELARAEPTESMPLRRNANEALNDLRGGESAPWCAADRKQCAEQALAAANALRDLLPEHCEGYAIHAQILIAQGDTQKGLDELDAAAEHIQEWNACTHALIDAALEAKEQGRVTAGLARLMRAGCASDDECVQTLQYVAGVELLRGNARRALAAYHQAYERAPNDALLLASGELASRVGLHAEALQDFTKLAQSNPSDARYTALIRTERDAISEAVTAPRRPPGP